jgi:hypothetical protein
MLIFFNDVYEWSTLPENIFFDSCFLIDKCEELSLVSNYLVQSEETVFRIIAFCNEVNLHVGDLQIIPNLKKDLVYYTKNNIHIGLRNINGAPMLIL